MPLNRFPFPHPGRGSEQRQPGRVAGEGAQVHRRPVGARQGRHRRRTAADPGTKAETILASCYSSSIENGMTHPLDARQSTFQHNFGGSTVGSS